MRPDTSLSVSLLAASCAAFLRPSEREREREREREQAPPHGMEEGECALGAAAIGEETLNYDGDDVEMADADSDAEEAPAAEVSAAAGGVGGGEQAEKGGPEGKNKRRKKRNKGKKKNKGRKDGSPTNIADINR
jgi:hypothetical protein